MYWEEFEAMSDIEFRQMMASFGEKVCVFPINGTRRWFMLEYPDQLDRYEQAYIDTLIPKYIELIRSFFDHGIGTLLLPSMGPALLERGHRYTVMILKGLMQLVTNQAFLDFYRTYGVNVRFYGDYRRYLESIGQMELIAAFERLENETAAYDRFHLLYGLFGHDATEWIAETAVTFAGREGRPPKRSELIEAYYGIPINAVDIFIGFDKPAAFDMPLIATGREDLYFTIAPSPYMTARHLRAILYDHLFLRNRPCEYDQLTNADWVYMRDFYRQYRHVIQGVGVISHQIWYPDLNFDLSGSAPVLPVTRSGYDYS